MQRAGVRARGRWVTWNKKKKKGKMHDTHDHKNTYAYQGHTYTHEMQDTYGGVAGDGLPIFAGGFHLRTGDTRTFCVYPQ